MNPSPTSMPFRQRLGRVLIKSALPFLPILRLLQPIVGAAFRLVNRFVPWHRLGTWLGIVNVIMLRNDLRQRNLHDTSQFFPAPPSGCPYHGNPLWREADGAFNDLDHPLMGRANTLFGRNFPLQHVRSDPAPERQLPSPAEISRALMTRHTFKPAESLNLLAAAWIQFQVHDWFGHQTSPESPAKPQDPAVIPLDPTDPSSRLGLAISRTPKTTLHPGGCPANVPLFLNTESHWWDGSQLYGSGAERQALVRSHREGKLRIVAGRLPSMGELDPDLEGVDLTGFNDNYWVGLSLFHTLFALEHNAICDALLGAYPDWERNDEHLFQTARLVNAALIAKIHTTEWTPALLAHPALVTGMKANWSGLIEPYFPEREGRLSDSEVLSGIPGSPRNHHSAPYYLTEEFVSVYRLHPLIPDDYVFVALDDPTVKRAEPFPNIQGSNTRKLLDELGLPNAWYSFGLAHPGAITLGNFPAFLQRHRRIKPRPDGTPDTLDVAAVDIFRDRERGVPRYNEFRRLLRLKPVSTFEELNAEWAPKLAAVYKGRLDDLDLMVGLLAETPPKGFAISDTAFRIFTLMAPRRLKSDRFFTTDYRPDVYTQMGMEWIASTTLRDVLLRHYPALKPALEGTGNVFAPWKPVPGDRESRQRRIIQESLPPERTPADATSDTRRDASPHAPASVGSPNGPGA